MVAAAGFTVKCVDNSCHLPTPILSKMKYHSPSVSKSPAPAKAIIVLDFSIKKWLHSVQHRYIAYQIKMVGIPTNLPMDNAVKITWWIWGKDFMSNGEGGKAPFYRMMSSSRLAVMFYIKNICDHSC